VAIVNNVQRAVKRRNICIYLDLSVRLKKSTRFSLVFALKTAGFSAFFTRFFPHRVKNVREFSMTKINPQNTRAVQ
jgi:hypothetical protein